METNWNRHVARRCHSSFLNSKVDLWYLDDLSCFFSISIKLLQIFFLKTAQFCIKQSLSSFKFWKNLKRVIFRRKSIKISSSFRASFLSRATNSGWRTCWLGFEKQKHKVIRNFVEFSKILITISNIIFWSVLSRWRFLSGHVLNFFWNTWF